MCINCNLLLPIPEVFSALFGIKGFAKEWHLREYMDAYDYSSMNESQIKLMKTTFGDNIMAEIKEWVYKRHGPPHPTTLTFTNICGSQRGTLKINYTNYIKYRIKDKKKYTIGNLTYYTGELSDDGTQTDNIYITTSQ